MVKDSVDTDQQGKFFKANGLRIFYETLGSGQGLIFLHGSMGTGRVWKPYLSILSQNFHVMVPDGRGHGKTDNPDGEIELELMADDVAAFIDAMELDKAILCGWSAGGDVALNVAMRYPEVVKGLIVGGVTFRISDTYHASLGAMGLEGPGKVNFEVAEKNIPELVALWKAEHAQSEDHWKSLITQLSHEMVNPPLPSEEELKQIDVPVLILWGDRDQFLPVEDAVDLYRLLPDAQLSVIPNADHFVTRTRVEEVAKLIEEFSGSL